MPTHIFLSIWNQFSTKRVATFWTRWNSLYFPCVTIFPVYFTSKLSWFLIDISPGLFLRVYKIALWRVNVVWVISHCQNVKKMAHCQKDVKMSKDFKLSKQCQMSKSQTAGLERRFAIKTHTQWSSHIRMSILMSHMKVINIWKHLLWPFGRFLMTIICDIKIDLIMCESHCVNFLWTFSIVSLKLFPFWYITNSRYYQVIWPQSNVSHLVVDVFSEFVNIFTEYVKIGKYSPRGCWGEFLVYLFVSIWDYLILFFYKWWNFVKNGLRTPITQKDKIQITLCYTSFLKSSEKFAPIGPSKYFLIFTLDNIPLDHV